VETGTVHQLSISPGGVPKAPVRVAVVGPLGIEGDAHQDTKHHGGPDRALCVWSLEVIEALRAEGHGLYPGAAGENVTVSGIPWELVVPGVVLRLGEVEAEITRPATPCRKNSRWFVDGDISAMDHRRHRGRSRMYAKVLTPGTIRPGDRVVLDR